MIPKYSKLLLSLVLAWLDFVLVKSETYNGQPLYNLSEYDSKVEDSSKVIRNKGIKSPIIVSSKPNFKNYEMNAPEALHRLYESSEMSETSKLDEPIHNAPYVNHSNNNLKEGNKKGNLYIEDTYNGKSLYGSEFSLQPSFSEKTSEFEEEIPSSTSNGITYYEEKPKEMMSTEYMHYLKSDNWDFKRDLKPFEYKYEASKLKDLNTPVVSLNKRPRFEYYKKIPDFDIFQKNSVIEISPWIPRSLVHFERIKKDPVHELNSLSAIRDRPSATVSPNGQYIIITSNPPETCVENKYDVFIRKYKSKKLKKPHRKYNILNIFHKLNLEGRDKGVGGGIGVDEENLPSRYVLLAMSDRLSKRQWKKYSYRVKDIALYIESASYMTYFCYKMYVNYTRQIRTAKYYQKIPKKIKDNSKIVQQRFPMVPFTAIGSYVPTSEDFTLLMKSVHKYITSKRRKLKFVKGKRVLFIGYQQNPVSEVSLPMEDDDLEKAIREQMPLKKQHKDRDYAKIFKKMKKFQYEKVSQFNLVYSESINIYIGVLKNLWMCVISGIFRIMKHKQNVSTCIIGNVSSYQVASVLNRVIVAMLKSSDVTNVPSYLLFPVSIGNERYGCKQYASDHLQGHLIERWDQPIFALQGYSILRGMYRKTQLYKYNKYAVRLYARAFKYLKFRYQRVFGDAPVLIMQQAFPLGFLADVQDCSRLARSKGLNKYKKLRVTILCMYRNGSDSTVSGEELMNLENNILQYSFGPKKSHLGEKKVIIIRNVNSPQDMDNVNFWLHKIRSKILATNTEMLIIPMLVVNTKSYTKNYKKLKKIIKFQSKNRQQPT
ncbi:hypothetical protein cand_016270 [Cryptosporidium andersoni]|uniref:Uncharacterized protein n=1 Tax=Cryptosporidium andersoni TaxID=117008 RepID=A0A1J4MVL7_9CRYT|nr:hypothetical protein cand_016270 [Cryptosporidium andersoni]